MTADLHLCDTLLQRANCDLRYSLGEEHQICRSVKYAVEISKMRFSGKGIYLRMALHKEKRQIAHLSGKRKVTIVSLAVEKT